MWFDESMKSAYEQGIQKAIETDTGYQPVRVDRVEYLGDIVERVIAEIRESRFVVADVTGQRNGVYFEGGFAMGLGIPVVWLCRKDEVKKLHFDTSHLNHIVWKNALELREKLSVRIRATIGMGPGKMAGS
jgi:nucleoside 2-deoxyribosyltransferase